MDVQLPYKDGWKITASLPSADNLIWIYVISGSMSGGFYATKEQAQELRAELTVAIDAATHVEVEE